MQDAEILLQRELRIVTGVGLGFVVRAVRQSSKKLAQANMLHIKKEQNAGTRMMQNLQLSLAGTDTRTHFNQTDSPNYGESNK